MAGKRVTVLGWGCRRPRRGDRVHRRCCRGCFWFPPTFSTRDELCKLRQFKERCELSRSIPGSRPRGRTARIPAFGSVHRPSPSHRSRYDGPATVRYVPRLLPCGLQHHRYLNKSAPAQPSLRTYLTEHPPAQLQLVRLLECPLLRRCDPHLQPYHRRAHVACDIAHVPRHACCARFAAQLFVDHRRSPRTMRCSPRRSRCGGATRGGPDSRARAFSTAARTTVPRVRHTTSATPRPRRSSVRLQRAACARRPSSTRRRGRALIAREPDKQLQAGAGATSASQTPYAAAAHGKSMSSVHTADTAAIERMAGTMDVAQRRWGSGSSSSRGAAEH